MADDNKGLDKLSIEELMGSKVISATRSEQQLMDTAAAAYVITQDDIRRSGATNIPEALRMVPGLHVARISPAKWAISARGSNGLVADKLLVLMDGRSLYSPINKGVNWEIQDRVLDDIERIEVIRGPGASVWGANAANGVINIITKNAANTKEGSVTAFAGDKYGVGLRKGWQFADQGYARVYGKFLRDETFTTRIGNDASEDWTSGRGGFRLDWANADGKHALMAQWDAYYGVYNENVDKNGQDPTNQPILNRVAKKGGNFLAKWSYNQSLSSRMSAQFFYDAFHESDSLTFTRSSEQFDFDFQHVLALNEAHEITWGLNYRLSNVELKPSTTPTVITEYLPKAFQNNRFTAFIQDKWRWDDDLEITFGSKFEHHNNRNFEYEPFLRVLWKVADQHRLWVGISRAVRLPAIADLRSDPENSFNLKQNENLKSDTVVSYEVGYRYWNADVFSLDLAAYYNQYSNNLELNGQFLNWFSDRSIAKNAILGFEATLAWRPFDWARFQLSPSFMARDIQSIRKAEDTFGITAQDPQFLCSFRGSFDITPEVELDLWLRYADPASGVLDLGIEVDPATRYPQNIPSYITLDARLAWRPNRNVELAVIANNLNDSQHPEFYDGISFNPLQTERMFWFQGHLKF